MNIHKVMSINTSLSPAPINKPKYVFPLNPAPLRFCWHIRVGRLRQIEQYRLEAYALFFYETYLRQHFEVQCKAIQALRIEPACLKRTMNYHRKLEKLFGRPHSDNRVLSLIEDKLEEYVHFEKNVLLDAMQEAGHFAIAEHAAAEEQGAVKTLAGWQDKFWEVE